jgi:hypothetical protein
MRQWQQDGDQLRPGLLRVQLLEQLRHGGFCLPSLQRAGQGAGFLNHTGVLLSGRAADHGGHHTGVLPGARLWVFAGAECCRVVAVVWADGHPSLCACSPA